MFEWHIVFEITPAEGDELSDERVYAVISEASNAADGLIAAVTCVRQRMEPGEGFRTIRVVATAPTDSDPNIQMPVARFE